MVNMLHGNVIYKKDHGGRGGVLGADSSIEVI